MTNTVFIIRYSLTLKRTVKKFFCHFLAKTLHTVFMFDKTLPVFLFFSCPQFINSCKLIVQLFTYWP